jgi:predicted acetyltransferase
MDFRLLNEETLPQAAALWDYCFEKKETPFHQWYFSQYCLKQNRILGGFEEGRLATMLHLNPYVIRLRGRDFRVPYIVGVATDPEARGNHVMGQLMDTCFTMLRAMKVPFAILMPIHAGLYQPYGFSYICRRSHYRVPLDSLDLAGSALATLAVRRIPTPEAENVIAPVYEKALTRYNGYAERDHRVWENLLITANQEAIETVIVKEDADVLGYALYNRDGETVKVQELITVSAPARLRLLQYFKGFYGNYRTLDWLAEEDDLTYLRLTHQEMAPRCAPFMMGRVVNAAQLLSELPVPSSLVGKELVIGVRDDTIALNTMLVKLRFSDKGTELLNTLEAPAALMDVGTLMQLAFGIYAPEQLLHAGLLHVETEVALAVLMELFPKQVNYINEYF